MKVMPKHVHCPRIPDVVTNKYKFDSAVAPALADTVKCIKNLCKDHHIYQALSGTGAPSQPPSGTNARANSQADVVRTIVEPDWGGDAVHDPSIEVTIDGVGMDDFEANHTYHDIQCDGMI